MFTWPFLSDNNNYIKNKSDIEILEEFGNFIETNESINFREELIYEILANMVSVNNKHILLLGESGVGKTFLVKSLAFLLEQKKINKLNDYFPKIYNLNYPKLFSKSIYRGQMEQICDKLFSIIERKKIIIFIDEIHNIMPLIKQDNSVDLANYLKPIMPNCNFIIIGATTNTEFEYLNRDKAFVRRFTVVNVGAPDKETTLKIASFTLSKLYTNFGIIFNNETLDLIYKYKYLWKNRQNPDLFIYCINKIASYVAKYDLSNEQFQILNQISEIKNQLKINEENLNYDKMALNQKEIMNLQLEFKNKAIEVSEKDIYDFLSREFPWYKIINWRNNNSYNTQIKLLNKELLNIPKNNEIINSILNLNITSIKYHKDPLIFFVLKNYSFQDFENIIINLSKLWDINYEIKELTTIDLYNKNNTNIAILGLINNIYSPEDQAFGPLQDSTHYKSLQNSKLFNSIMETRSNFYGKFIFLLENQNKLIKLEELISFITNVNKIKIIELNASYIIEELEKKLLYKINTKKQYLKSIKIINLNNEYISFEFFQLFSNLYQVINKRINKKEIKKTITFDFSNNIIIESNE